MGRKGTIRRRAWGAAFLAIALGMLLAGETVLRDRLGPLAFLLFWLVCFAFTSLALLVAFLDVSIIRQRSHQEQRALFENTLREIAGRTRPTSPQRNPPDPNRKTPPEADRQP